MVFKLYFFIILFFSTYLNGQIVIIVFGPSCSGKSTLSKKIARQLGNDWQAIDRDILIESGKLDPYDLKAFAQYLNQQAKEACMVVDTNFYTDDFFNLIEAGTKIRVLVYAPLSKLLERDKFRTDRLQRSAERARNARLFVHNNYDYFFNDKNKKILIGCDENNQIFTPYAYDLLADSTSLEKSATTIENIKELLTKGKK